MREPDDQNHFLVRARWPIAAAIFVTAFGFYWMTRVHLHTYDGWTYAMSAQVGTASLFHLLLSHHLLYHPLMYGFLSVLDVLGYSAKSMGPLELANTAIASACLVVFYLTCRRRFGQLESLGIALLLMISNAFWLYSSEVEVYHLSLIFQLLLVNRLIDLDANHEIRNRNVYSIALCLSLAVLAHQTNVLLIVLVGVAILSHASPWKAKLRAFVRIGVLSVVSTITVFGLAATLLGLRSMKDVLYWLTAYAHLGVWGQLNSESPGDSLSTQISSFVHLPGTGLLVVGVGVVIVLAVSIVAYKVDRRLAMICLSWYLPNLFFFSWWEATNIEFWIAAIPPMLLLFGAAISSIPRLWRGAALTGIFLMVPLVAWSNWSGSVSERRDPSADTRDESSLALVECLPDGLLIVANDYAYPWIAYHYHPSQARMLDLYFFFPDQRHQGVINLKRDVQRAFESEKAVFITEEAIDKIFRDATFYGYQPTNLKKFFDGFERTRTTCSYDFGPADVDGIFELKIRTG